MNFLTADIALEVDIKKLARQLAKAKASAVKASTTMQKSFKKLEKASKRIFSNIGQYAKLAGAALLAAGVASVKMASDVQDSEDFFEMSMGAMADATRQWSEELASALHLNQYEIRETIAVFNEMTTSMGLNEKAAAALSQRYTKLAYDLVSYHPKVRSLEQASTVLQAALTGERETLKRLGYYYSENEVKLKSIELGYGKNLQALTALQKLEINDIILMGKMKNVHGDLARTLESSQNVFRAVWTQVKLLGVAFGDKLRPEITELAVVIRDYLIENQDALIIQLKELWDWITKVTKVFYDWRKEIGITVIALASMAILVTVGGWITTLTKALWGLALALGVVGAAVIKWRSIFLGMVILSGSLKLGLLNTLGLIKLKLVGVLAVLAKFPVVLAAAFAVIQVTRAILKIREYYKEAEKAREALDRLWRLETKFAARNRLRAEGFLEDSPLVREAKKYAEILKQRGVRKRPVFLGEIPPSPIGEEIMAHLAKQKLERQRELNLELLEEHKSRLETSKTATENYGVMMSALQFELDHLGQMDEMRERAATYAEVELETQNMLNLSAEERNQKLSAYMELFDKLQEKQASFSHAVQLWYNSAAKWGKNFGDVLTNAFDGAADSFADMLMNQEADWKAFGRMFVKELLVMILKLQMAFALQTALGYGVPGGGLLGSLFGGGATGSTFANPMAVMGAPSGQHGGEVTQTGLAKIHKGESLSGVNNEMGFGGITVNNYVGDSVDVEVMDEERVINITRIASIQMANYDGDYRGAHGIGGE